MNHWLRFASPAAIIVATLVSATPARASSPMSVYSRTDSVKYEPDKANAQRVVISGAFSLKTSEGMDFAYTEPAGDYMYYACAPGQEAACRQQWQEIEDAIGKNQCVGWGQIGGKGAGTVRGSGTAPANPDTYDLGMGVQVAQSAGGICPKLLSFNGKPGTSTSSSSGTTSSSSGGTSSSSGATSSTSSGNPGPSEPTPAPPAGGGNGGSGGCGVSPKAAPFSLAALAVAAAFVASRRRRR